MKSGWHHSICRVPEYQVMMAGSISDYIGSDGAAEILATIDPEEGTRWSELVNRVVTISEATVTKRLHEGRELDLVMRVPVEGKQRGNHTYALTPKGGRIRFLMEMNDTATLYRSLQRKWREVEEEVAEVEEWIAEHGDELEDEGKNQSHLSRLWEGNDLPPDIYEGTKGDGRYIH